jgi:hypothetical protein
LALAVLLTKLLTQPLRGRFEGKEALAAAEMIGQCCRITTSEVTEKFGQAEYKSEGAPLLIHVRTRVPTSLTKGDVAMLVDYDTETHVYFVEKPTGEEPE